MTAWTHNQLIGWIQRVEAKAARATLFELLELGTTADSAQITAAFHRIAGGAHPDLHRHALSPQDSDRLVSAYGKIAAAYDTLRDPKSRDRYRKELADRGRPVSMPPVIGGSQAIPIQRPVSPSAALAGRSTGPLPSVTMGPPLPTTQPLPRAASPSLGPSATRDPTPSRGTPAVTRNPTPSRGTPAVTRAPLITPAPKAETAPPSTTRPPTRPPATTTASGVAARRPDSRPPQAGIAPRAQAYFRKAQACLTQGDLGGAMFNLRLAAAADPGSALIKVALAEVESEILGTRK